MHNLTFYEIYKPHIEKKIRLIHKVPFPSHGLLVARPEISDAEIAEMFEILSSFDQGAGFFWQIFRSISKDEIAQLHAKQKSSVAVLKELIAVNQNMDGAAIK